jgi:hypothetical protein
VSSSKSVSSTDNYLIDGFIIKCEELLQIMHEEENKEGNEPKVNKDIRQVDEEFLENKVKKQKDKKLLHGSLPGALQNIH